MLVWRASMPLRRNLLELQRAVVGRQPPAYYRAREAGKTYFRSLEKLVQAGRGEVE
jgi:hypothetical protein